MSAQLAPWFRCATNPSVLFDAFPSQPPARARKIRAEAVREVLAYLAKAEADARLAREELTKATQRQSQQVLRSPVDGVVQQLAITSEGAVLKAADPILVVVPDSGELIVEAQVLNRDAGFVEAGQPVTV